MKSLVLMKRKLHMQNRLHMKATLHMKNKLHMKNNQCENGVQVDLEQIGNERARMGRIGLTTFQSLRILAAL